MKKIIFILTIVSPLLISYLFGDNKPKSSKDTIIRKCDTISVLKARYDTIVGKDTVIYLPIDTTSKYHYRNFETGVMR